jgi:hypothetical protein
MAALMTPNISSSGLSQLRIGVGRRRPSVDDEGAKEVLP